MTSLRSRVDSARLGPHTSRISNAHLLSSSNLLLFGTWRTFGKKSTDNGKKWTDTYEFPRNPQRLPRSPFCAWPNRQTYNHRYPLRFGHFWNRHLDQRSQGLRLAFCDILVFGSLLSLSPPTTRAGGMDWRIGFCVFYPFWLFLLISWNSNLPRSHNSYPPHEL